MISGRFRRSHDASTTLELAPELPLVAANGGLFISSGRGRHPDRTLDSYELIFVIRGRLRLREDSSDYEIREGEALLLWPHRRHRGLGTYAPDLRFFWIHFRAHGSSGADAERRGLSVPQHVAVRRRDHLTSLFRRFLDDQEGGILSPIAADLLVMLMLNEVANSRPQRSDEDQAASVLANRVDALIRTRYHEALCTSSIAHILHRNPDYLGRVYKRVQGTTITEAIHAARLKQARRLLLESDRTIEAIARSCGYHDTSYFRRRFRRAEGLSPHRYRRLHARLHVNTG